MRSIVLKSAAALALITGALGAIPAAAQDDAELYVLHGVPGLTVDVCVNGAVQLPDFTPGTLAGPLSLPAGTYTVAIFADTTDCSGTPAIGPIDLPLAAGMNYTAVAHLDADDRLLGDHSLGGCLRRRLRRRRASIPRSLCSARTRSLISVL